MKGRLFSWLLAVQSLGALACISDLKPDVGDLIESGDGTPAGDGDGTPEGDGTPAGDGDGSPMGDGDTMDDGGVLADGGGVNDAGPTEEDSGSGPVEGCDIDDSDRSVRVSFLLDVKPILDGCNCHDSGSSDPFAILESGLTIEGYETLRAGGDTTGPDIVIDRNPCDSIILKKLSETPPFGERMPLDGPYLSVEERTLISDWIVEGAHDN